MSDEPTFDIFTDEIAGADAPPTPADAAEFGGAQDSTSPPPAEEEDDEEHEEEKTVGTSYNEYMIKNVTAEVTYTNYPCCDAPWAIARFDIKLRRMHEAARHLEARGEQWVGLEPLVDRRC